LILVSDGKNIWKDKQVKGGWNTWKIKIRKLKISHWRKRGFAQKQIYNQLL
jgi:hypothetical protein